MTALATEHVRELAARKSGAYELLLALEENPHADESCFRSLALIVDWIASHPISLEGGTLDDLRLFVRSQTQDLASTLPVLALALSEAANPGRMRVLLTGYANWLREISGLARPHFLGILPNIAANLDELEGGGLEKLIACLNACSCAEDCELLAECVGRYQETSGSILLAAAEIAGLAIRTDSRPLVQKLMIAVTPEAMVDSKAARELLPALARLKTAGGKWTGSEPGRHELVWKGAISVCVEVAAINHSSALHLARHLREALAKLTVERQLAYLNSFQGLIEAAGTSLLGYGTTQLPALFQEVGDERALQFVAQGIAIARRYGRVAAEEFFEQRSGASRQALPAG
ncbi:MAG TPA: hypothetical protein VGG72_11850 [Bryobacteraceae bacterium]|jgi:hypothetical protein